MAHIRPYRSGWRAELARSFTPASKTFKTKREAQAWVVVMESKGPGGPSKTLQEAVDHYLKTVSTQKRDAVEWERRRFKALVDHFGDIPLSTIDSNALGGWRDSRLAGDENNPRVSGSTVLREVNLYRNLFKLAVNEWGWMIVDPFKGVRLPKENLPRDTVWRWPQIRRVLREGQARGGKTLEVTQAFHIALRTAMRLQEALAAPGGFDVKRRVVMVVSKTSARPEAVPLTRAGFRLMSTMPKFVVDANEASVLFSSLCKQLLIKGLQFRDSRATALTLMARKVDILTLARISRHRDLDLLRSTYYRETADEISARL